MAVKYKSVLKRLPLALAAIACMAVTPAAAHPPMAARPLSRMDLPWWKHRFEEKQAELKGASPDLLWLGDSITENWEHNGPQAWNNFKPVWDKYYGKLHAINLGFKGDATSHLLWRIENGETSNMSPKVAIILIGANNFGHLHWDAQATLQGIDAILAELQNRLPKTKLILLSVLPSDRSAWISEQTDIVNSALPEHAKKFGASYVDLTPVFAPTGHLERDLYLDSKLTPPDPLLHPDADGQAKMAAAIEPTLKKLLAQ